MYARVVQCCESLLGGPLEVPGVRNLKRSLLYEYTGFYCRSIDILVHFVHDYFCFVFENQSRLFPTLH